jgi:UDP-N-acetylmuramoyl-L-alanyl-D-glutamate--2,6-diaminopimelate ligase
LRLKDLCRGLEINIPDGQENNNIRGITIDSRKVQPGYMFIAISGNDTDGIKFVRDAQNNGAVAIVSSVQNDKSLLYTPDTRKIAGVLAARFYAGQPKNIVAITGTNGKTSTAHFCRNLWLNLGKKAASIGTLGIIKNNDAPLDFGLTTPDPILLHENLRRMEVEDIEYVAMEASSHGLEQGRLEGVQFKAGAFLNITRDHLDYHKTMEAYLAAKLLLVTRYLKKGSTIVVNADIPEFSIIKESAEKLEIKIKTFSNSVGDLALLKQQPLPNGQILHIKWDDREYVVELPLLGAYQAENIMAAMLLVQATGFDKDNIINAVKNITPVPGRMDVAATTKSGCPIIVDYAHTPDALEKLLQSVRPHVEGSLHIVFGCGGDRDAGKRPIMGGIADRLADFVYVTDDNPRTENAGLIRSQIMESCQNAKNIGNRAEAIKTAISSLEKGDLLVIAGKGHETYQIYGKEKLPFNDAEEARKNV